MHRTIHRIRQGSAASRTLDSTVRTSFTWAHDRICSITSPCSPSRADLSTSFPSPALTPSNALRSHQCLSARAFHSESAQLSKSAIQESTIATTEASAPSVLSSESISLPQSKSLVKPTKESTRKKTVYQWTPELDAIIISMHKDHSIDWRTIGKVLDRPFTTCYYRYLNNIKPLLDSGHSMVEIQDKALLNKWVKQGSAMIQAKKEAMEEAKKAQSIPPKEVEAKDGRIEWTAEMDQTICDMVQAGKPWPEIGKALDRHYSTCYSRYYSALDPALKLEWSPESIARLREMVTQGVPWKKISRELRMHSLICKAKWTEVWKNDLETAGVSDSGENLVGTDDPTKKKTKNKAVTFSLKESALIMSLAEKYGIEDWDRILQDFQQQLLSELGTPSPSSKSTIPAHDRILGIKASHLCKQYLRLNHNKNFWTMDQETTLIQQVLKHGTEGDGVWEKIASLTGSHSAQECRTHWKKLDMPDIPNYNIWTKTEQGTFWSALQQFGPDFQRIAKYCSNRSADDCKDYYESMTKDFPDPASDPAGFQKRIKEVQESLPYTRQKYNFTKERSQRLQRAMQYCQQRFGSSPTGLVGTWQWIANKVQRGLSPATCIEHWNYLRQNLDVVYGPYEEFQTTPIKPANSSSWSHEESKLLEQGIREFGVNWIDIQKHYLPWRSNRSLRQRWFLMSDRSIRVTEEEYYTILAAGEKVDAINYDELIKKLTGWNRSPCRRVFETSYKHIVANTVWTPEDDRLLLEAVIETFGRDWRAVAEKFEGIQPAMAPLYQEAMKREADEVAKMREKGIEPPPIEIPRVQKTPWQCRLRWCQLVEPIMPGLPILTVNNNGRSIVLRLSKKLLEKKPVDPK